MNKHNALKELPYLSKKCDFIFNRAETVRCIYLLRAAVSADIQAFVSSFLGAAEAKLEGRCVNQGALQDYINGAIAGLGITLEGK